ncbi:monooxygenase, partial [Glutamicibacter sp. BW80]|uniref:FAD-dependent monooxygenase n=1 Tax=Glutamicibacter sp. BW80 TaxID=2024404 RepID=UPI000BB6AC57
MDADVIIVGAGPAGLLLAGELRLAGTTAITLEKRGKPSGESRGLGFTARTMEIFRQRDILKRFGEVTLSERGHFGGIPIDFSVLDGAEMAAKSVPQSHTERVLEDWALELGSEIRRGHEVTGFTEFANHVEVSVSGPQGAYKLQASYLVGADGGRSTIRKLGSFPFPGTESTMEMFLADVQGLDLEPRMIGEILPGGMVMVGHLPNDVTRLIVCERRGTPPKRTVPLEFQEVSQAWKRLTGVDISHGKPIWVSAFGNATRLVDMYSKGRVFLTGDSAHIHLPAGGQGMNVSLQDAMNLGWKLAAVCSGKAPLTLLESYNSERRPVGERLMLNTQAQGLLFLSGPEIQPLRELIRELTQIFHGD